LARSALEIDLAHEVLRAGEQRGTTGRLANMKIVAEITLS
jgi:hypothetical protein